MASGTFYPAVGGDDGTWKTGYFDNAGFLYLGDSNGDMGVFVRFTNVTIPRGATITNAYVRFTTAVSSTSAPVYLNVYFNDVDDAAVPTDVSEANALTLTSAVAWDNLPSWSDGVQYNTVDLTSILQDITSRIGFSSGNAVQVVIRDDGCGVNIRRIAAGIDHVSGAEKPELHVTWEVPPEMVFTFSDPVPEHLSTVYGTTKQLYLTTTISGQAESYIYDAAFYDSFGAQIGTTVLGVNSGNPVASNAYLSTASGIDYSWYVVATSSGSEEMSSTYTFFNRFLYEGYVTENNNPVSRTVRLYYRDTGELIDSTTSSGGNGYYNLTATINDEHFIVAFDDEAGEDYNSLILDKLLPNGE